MGRARRPSCLHLQLTSQNVLIVFPSRPGYPLVAVRTVEFPLLIRLEGDGVVCVIDNRIVPAAGEAPGRVPVPAQPQVSVVRRGCLSEILVGAGGGPLDPCNTRL